MIQFLESYEFFTVLALAGCFLLLAGAAFAMPNYSGRSGGNGRNVVIYARYSSDKQREDSIDDQIRTVRIHLDKLGIPHENAVVLSDSGISGERIDRENYQKLREMIANDQVSILACDEQSRLTRGPETGILMHDLQLYDSRFLTADGYDSLTDPDGLLAIIKGCFNQKANRDHAHRVRRGIAGRTLDKNGADGSHPFGYSSRYCDPVAAAQYQGNGPRPKKEVYIHEAEAAVVRDIFTKYAGGMSLSDVARDLNQRGVAPGKQSIRHKKNGLTSHNGWHKTLIHNFLVQDKYRGLWVWGEYKHRKTPNNKRITTLADPRDVVRSERPELAIVSQELWDKVQVRLAANREKYGFKKGQKKRGPKPHYTEDYPTNILSGVLFCGECGKRMEFIRRENCASYFHCPIARRKGKHNGETACTLAGWVSYEKASAALIDYLRDDLHNSRDWVEHVHEIAVAEYKKQAAFLPNELENMGAELAEVIVAIDSLVDLIEKGRGGPSVEERLKVREARKTELEAAMKQCELVKRKTDALPSLEWVRGELENLAGILGEDPRKTALLFREYFGKVRVFVVVAPGKQRGHPELVFRGNRQRLVQNLVNGSMGRAVDETDNSATPVGDEVRIALSSNDKLDKLMPAIHAMREAGKTWKEICTKFNIATSWTQKYYDIWRGLMIEPQQATEPAQDNPGPASPAEPADENAS